MTDATKIEKETETPTPEKEEDKKVPMTQAEIDKIVGKARMEAKAQADKDYAKQLADMKRELEVSKMSEAEKAKADIERREKLLQERAETAETKLKVLSAERELAKIGLPTEVSKYVIGKDDEETVSNVKVLKTYLDAEVTKQVKEAMARGAPPASGDAKNTSNAVLDSMKKGAGIKDKKT